MSIQPKIKTRATADDRATQSLDALSHAEMDANFLHLLSRGYVTPEDFGATDDIAVDSTDELEAFLTAAANDDAYRFALTGRYGLTRGLSVDGLARASMCCDATFDALSEITEPILTFNSVSHKHFQGVLRYDGQTTDYGDRKAHRGFRVGTSAFNATLPSLWATGVKGFALDCIVNSNSVTIPKVYSGMCGTRSAPASAGRPYQSGYTLDSNTGSSGSATQRSVLSVDAATPPKEFTPLVKIGEKYHLWMEEDAGAGTISVYPWVSDTIGQTGTLDFITGGTLAIRGNGSNGINVGHVSGLQSGITLYSTSPAGVYVGSLISEFAEVGIAFGLPGLNTHTGAFVGQSYYEALRIDAVQTSLAGHANLVLGPRFSYATAFGISAQLGDFSRDVNGSTPNIQHLGPGSIHERAPYTNVATVSVDNDKARGVTARTVTTTDPARATTVEATFDAAALRTLGHDTITVDLIGYDTGDVTVTSADAGITVEGSASHVIAGVGQGYAQLRLVLVDDDIKVSIA